MAVRSREHPLREYPLREMSSETCAVCSAPLASTGVGVEAWRVGNQFVCNEFCADGIPDEPGTPKAAAHLSGPVLPLRIT